MSVDEYNLTYSLKSGRWGGLIIKLGLMLAYGCHASLAFAQTQVQNQVQTQVQTQIQVKDVVPITEPTLEPVQIVKPDPTLDPVYIKGKKLFSRCDQCHTLGAGEEDDRGPNLHGIFGALAGQRPDFEYSEPMLTSGIIWDEANMDALLRKPKDLVPKTSMVFWGMRKDADRAALIQYLKHATQPTVQPAALSAVQPADK